MTDMLPEVMNADIIQSLSVIQQFLIIPDDMPEGTLRAILKQAGVAPDIFLKK